MEQIISFIVGLLHISPSMLAAVLGILFAVSELLSLIPAVNSNGVFQLIFSLVKKLMGKDTPSLPKA